MYIATAKPSTIEGNIERCQFVGMFVVFFCCFFLQFSLFFSSIEEFFGIHLIFAWKFENKQQFIIQHLWFARCTMLNRIKLYQQLVVCLFYWRFSRRYLCDWFVDCDYSGDYKIGDEKLGFDFRLYGTFINGDKQFPVLPIAQPKIK